MNNTSRIPRLIIAATIFTGSTAFVNATASSACAALPTNSVAFQSLQQICDKSWRKMMTTWHEKTGIVYGCPTESVRSSRDCVNGMFHWTGGGYGDNMEDCALICGTALSGLVDRYTVLGDAQSRDDAAKVARGLLNLAKLHGIKGFVARGLCADDGKSICSLSSRDQYTHWVHGLWRYSMSPMADPALLSEYKKLIVDVAEFMENRVVPEREWNFGLADGGKDPRGICTMWGPALSPHEDARLPMIYAAAYMATNDRHWLTLYESIADAALDLTLRVDGPNRAKFLGRMPCYSLYQANASLELLCAFEKDNNARRAKIARAMRAFSDIAANRACTAMRNPHAKPPYGMCWDGELALTMLMVSGVPDAEVAVPFLKKTLSRLDYAKSDIIQISHVMAAFWRAAIVLREKGVML